MPVKSLGKLLSPLGGAIEIFLADCCSVVHSDFHFCRGTEDSRGYASDAKWKGLGTRGASGATAPGLGRTPKGSADQRNLLPRRAGDGRKGEPVLYLVREFCEPGWALRQQADPGNADRAIPR